MPEVATPNQGEREFETGSDEFAKAQSELNQAASALNHLLAALNIKRTYDTYQSVDLDHTRNLNNLALQAMQNAIETANLAGKQYLKHADLAADSYWNPVTAGAGMNLTAGSVPSNRTIDQETAVAGGAVTNASAGVAAAVAKQVDATITPVLAVLQQLVESLATTNASIANVLAQVQPKTAA